MFFEHHSSPPLCVDCQLGRGQRSRPTEKLIDRGLCLRVEKSQGGFLSRQLLHALLARSLLFVRILLIFIKVPQILTLRVGLHG